MFAMVTNHCYAFIFDGPDLKVGIREERNPDKLISMYLSLQFVNLPITYQESAKL